jgi:SAM-dependent methyltransferase
LDDVRCRATDHSSVSALSRLGLDALPHSSATGLTGKQEQTGDAFGFKWANRATYESAAVTARARAWLLERYCAGDPARLREWLAGGRKIILDAGCGSGYSALALFGPLLAEHDYLGVDISSAVDVARQRFAERGIPAEFLRRSLMELPVPDGSIDMIFSEGVLHHTDDTERAFRYLTTKLRTGGRFLAYIYARKGPIREFTDDHVRAHLRDMTDDEAWRALEPLTHLGIALGELGVTLDVPEDIPFLGIKKGPVDLQRFVYWHICKMFYRPDYTFDEMHHVNFDWFRPLNCHRHTPDEVRRWCAEAAMTVERLNVQESGITVVEQ